MRFILIMAVLGALAGGAVTMVLDALTPEPPEAYWPAAMPEPGPRLEVLQVGDSVGFRMRWVPNLAGGQPTMHRWHLLDMLQGAKYSGPIVAGLRVLAMDSVPMPADTAVHWLPFQAGDTVSATFRVQAVDGLGRASPWVESQDTVVVGFDPGAPLAPSGLQLDTLGYVLFDSLEVVSWRHAFNPSTQGYEVNTGDTLRFAAIAYSGGLPVACIGTQLGDPPGTHPCDQYTFGWNWRELFPDWEQVPYRFVEAARIPKQLEGRVAGRGLFYRPDLWELRRALFAFARSERLLGS